MNPQSNTSSHWFVLYTKPRAEKKLTEQLIQDGIEAYCPTQVEIKQWSDRKKKVETPVLPSMILVNIPDQERHQVFNRTHALRYLYWLGKPATVTSEEVESLRSITEDSQFESQELQSLKPGEKLDMTAMGFEQIQGTVKYVNAKECWIVLENVGYVVKFKKSQLEF
ncbi:UpxY family transcription antiterminator [Psychroflexus sp. CAK57W]|uniref:UpxY family transcription antiterminator n=1 Tax=Psychroflexus curvus TaxID=2873595 RepID=UPI001CCE5A79|nr:UpxY family transcription antiterminator [Psychroflexus curvus]MBZ9627098.1 UpxY family transcription antiterminator [Psychroflexus curvus]MBZ9787104.1 UpxY family transcription antiterminator [Psychroflexus curvus]